MPQQFMIVLEKAIDANDGTDEIWNQVKCSNEVFQHVFGVEYQSGIPFGEKVATVAVSGTTMSLVSQKDRTFNKTGNVIATTRGYMTAGSWSLFQVLSDKGFRLLDQRTYDVVQFSSTLNGRRLVERIFVRDL